MLLRIQSNQQLVEAAVACGFTETEIADRLAISLPELREQFSEELHSSEFNANLAVLRSLLFLATERLHPGVAMFWAKVRCGWGSEPPAKDSEREQLFNDQPVRFVVYRNDHEPNQID
jgi:hypothetical protein